MEVALQEAGHVTTGVHNADAALTVLERGGVDLVISDYRMPGRSGLSLLRDIEEQGLGVPLIMVTGHGSIDHAVSAMKEGAADYITKPWKSDALRIAADQALEMVRLRKENAQLRQEVSKLRSDSRIVGESPALRDILDTVAVVAPTRSTVLLQGESGTGKELIARSVHDLSERRDGAFISINCAALPENLVESTLFGHEKGAFTGAHRRVLGAFERANGGTLLLDEVTEMRLETQAKLLRVLQEQEFERVGGTKTLKVDVRIVATTNRDMAELVAERRFREDLYYRLSVVPLRVPPLRERRNDLPLLVHHFANKSALEIGRPVPGVSPEAIDLLLSHGWPGNIRELAHCVERAVILNQDPVLTPDAFLRTGLGRPVGDSITGGGFEPLNRDGGVGGDPSDASQARADVLLRLPSHNIAMAEEALIRMAMEESGENKTRAADLLGIHVRTLRKKLNEPSDTRRQGSPPLPDGTPSPVE